MNILSHGYFRCTSCYSASEFYTYYGCAKIQQATSECTFYTVDNMELLQIPLQSLSLYISYSSVQIFLLDKFLSTECESRAYIYFKY